jgi:hypothetical protein
MRGAQLYDYPHVWPRPGFIPIGRFRSVAIAPGATAQLLETIQIPTGMDGWIKKIGIELSSYSNGVSYSLLQNGIPIRDYALITVPIGSPDTPTTQFIQLNPNQTVTLVGKNPTVAPVAARWYFYGWYFPRT